MSYDRSLVLISPVANKATVEAKGVKLGYSGNEYTVPLSPTGSEPATHYGLHTWATEATVLAWTVAPAVPNLMVEEVTWLRSKLTIRAELSSTLSGSAHFDAVLAGNGLQRINTGDLI